MSSGQTRQVPVPDGLDGERLDAALARMFGLSRARAADLIADGAVLAGGATATKSDRVTAGEWLEVTLPGPPAAAQPPQPVPGMDVVYEDADIVVVDKPVGVAAHPTPGWTGPTVLQGLLAAGHTLATSGAAERQGIVHRLDANTSGLMVVARSERAYSVLKQAFRDREVDKTYHALVQATRTRCEGQSTPRSAATRPATAASRWWPAAATRSPTTTRWRRSARPACWRSSSKQAAPTRSGCTWPRCGTRASATGCTARTRCWPPTWA